MKGKAAEINGLCGAFLFMWNRFEPDTDEFRKEKLLLRLNKEFEGILNEYPVSEGHFALPPAAAERLVDSFRNFGAVYVHLSDYSKDQGVLLSGLDCLGVGQHFFPTNWS